MLKLNSVLASVGDCRLPSWGLRDEFWCWLDTLKDPAQNWIQWRKCYGLSVEFVPLRNNQKRQPKYHRPSTSVYYGLLFQPFSAIQFTWHHACF